MSQQDEKFFDYQSPLSGRYASQEMRHLFSRHQKALLWRELWIALAKKQKELGLTINEEQISELEAQKTNIDFTRIQHYERQFRHDVMAHVHHYGDLCPKAKKIIHSLGAWHRFPKKILRRRMDIPIVSGVGEVKMNV